MQTLNDRFRVPLRVIVFGFLCLVVAPRAADAGVYAYSEVGVSGSGSVIYLQAVGIAVSDDPDPGVGVDAWLYDPSNNVLAHDYAYTGSGWDIVAYGTQVALSDSSTEGTYNAQGIGWTSGGSYGCSPFAPVQISAFRHHYDFTSMGNPNTYTLNANSQNLACSHSTLTWDTTSLSGLTDTGLYAHFGSTPAGCLSLCTAGKTGSVTGPAGSTLGPASCG